MQLLAESLPLTDHARSRMDARRLSAAAVALVLRHGRKVRVRGACIHVVGRKEVALLAARGIDARRAEGVQVVCAPDGDILTVYRNRDLRGLRPRGRRAATVLH